MEGKITYRVSIKKDTDLINLKLSNGVSAKLYVVKGFKNEINWSKFKIGDNIGGLQWFDKKSKIIDADSPVYPL